MTPVGSPMMMPAPNVPFSARPFSSSAKTGEAIGSLAKGSFESTNETITKQVNAAKKAAGTR